MPNQLDERASEILRQAIESFGVKIYLNTRVEKISGDGSVEGIVTKDGDVLPCKKAVYSVGIKPNVEIVQGTLIKHQKGIVVNEKNGNEHKRCLCGRRYSGI